MKTEQGEQKRLVVRENVVKDLEVSESEVTGHAERLLVAPSPGKPVTAPAR